MSLRASINAFDNAGLQVLAARPRALQRAMERVERKAEGLEVPEDLENFDYEEAITNLRAGWASRRELRRLASGGLSTIENHSERDVILETLLSALRTTRLGLLKALLIGYLILPDNDTSTARTVRRFLLQHQGDLPARWSERVDQFRLLGDNVGKHCAAMILQGSYKDGEAFFLDSGLKGVKSSGGVAFRVFETLAVTLEKGHSSDGLERFLAFVRTSDGIRFSTHLSMYARALLSPYLSQQPDDKTLSVIEPFLLEYFGDPRMNPGRWASVPEDLVGVMKRWLAKASIELLLKVVDKSNDTVQWEERHAFWSHYFDLGLITDAWVALGRDAALVARRLVRQGVLHGASDYGVIDRGSVQPDHSVLIFRLQDFVISEWTHSGKVRIYDAANKHSPKFYQRRYSADLLRRDQNANVRVIHHSNWRGKVSGFLQYELGISAPKGIYPGRETRRCVSCKSTMHALWFDGATARSCSRCKLRSIYE
jgi:hypothetical protein